MTNTKVFDTLTWASNASGVEPDRWFSYVPLHNYVAKLTEVDVPSDETGSDDIERVGAAIIANALIVANYFASLSRNPEDYRKFPRGDYFQYDASNWDTAEDDGYSSTDTAGDPIVAKVEQTLDESNIERYSDELSKRIRNRRRRQIGRLAKPSVVTGPLRRSSRIVTSSGSRSTGSEATSSVTGDGASAVNDIEFTFERLTGRFANHVNIAMPSELQRDSEILRRLRVYETGLQTPKIHKATGREGESYYMKVSDTRINFSSPRARRLRYDRTSGTTLVGDAANARRMIDLLTGAWRENAIDDNQLLPSTSGNAFAALVSFSMGRYYFGDEHHPKSARPFSVSENDMKLRIDEVIQLIDQFLEELGFVVVRR